MVMNSALFEFRTVILFSKTVLGLRITTYQKYCRIYSISFLFGFLDGSLDKNPNVKREIKKITTV